MPRTALYILPFFVVAAVGIGWLLIKPDPPKTKGLPPEQPLGQQPPNGPPPPAGSRPKLVVLVVFDQLRSDYLLRWAPHFGPGGFERLKKDGVWFSDCRIPYACTLTGPGHASLVTGAPPAVHGIVSNDWYDRAAGRTVYCCEPKGRAYSLLPPVPVDGGAPERGSATGYSPERLLSPTVGDELVAATGGKGRVFTFSIKDRTAVLMGGQKPSGVYCFDTRDGQFHTGAFYPRDAEHPWVKAFNAARPADRWFGAKWDRFKPDLDYAAFSGPDDALGEADGPNGMGRTFPRAMAGKLTAPGKRYYEAVECSPFGNDLVFELAKQCVMEESLGRGGHPDLLCVSFSSNDLIGHRWGPDSQEVFDVTLRTDQLIADLLTFLDDTVGKDNYVVVVSADHGVCPLPERPGTKEQYPATQRVVFDAKTDLPTELAAALDTAFGLPAGKTKWFDAFDGDTWPWVYLNHKVLAEQNLKLDDVAVYVRDWLAGRGFVEAAFTSKELEARADTDPPLKRAAALSYRADRSGDVIVFAKPGVLVTSYPMGTTHGSPHLYDRHVPFLVYGAGVPALGEQKEEVSSLAIAPTLAWALGLPVPRDAAADRPHVLPVKK